MIPTKSTTEEKPNKPNSQQPRRVKEYPITKDIEHRVNEAITAYVPKLRTPNEPLPFIGSLRNKVTYDDFLADKLMITCAIRKGIPYSLFHEIQQYSPFSENEWADFLGISTKSLHRYKTASEHYFKSIHSEKIIEMAEVIKVGLDVFGNMDKLKLWLITPSFALGKLKPIELLKDSYGKELVLGELIGINHGILV